MFVTFQFFRYKKFNFIPSTPKICKLYALSPKRHLDFSFEFLSSKRHCQIRSDEGDRYACLLLLCQMPIDFSS